MKQNLHKLISVLLSLVVLFSTLSFTVDQHYCGDELVDVAVFSELEGCGDEDDHAHDQAALEEEKEDSCCTPEDNHCKDIKTEIEGDPVDYFGFQKSELQKVFFVVPFFASYQQECLEAIDEAFVYKYTSQLKNQKDRVVLFENFRI